MIASSNTIVLCMKGFFSLNLMQLFSYIYIFYCKIFNQWMENSGDQESFIDHLDPIHHSLHLTWIFLCDIVCTLPGIGGGWAVGARVDPGPAVGGMMAGQSGRGQHGSSGLYFSLQVSGTWFRLGHLFNRWIIKY